MRVKTKYSGVSLPLDQFLTSDDRGDGALERASHLAYEADQKIGRLLATLVESGFLRFDDACKVAGVSGYDCELIPDND